MSKERFMIPWCLAYFISFLVAIRILSHSYIVHDDLVIGSSLAIVVKKIKK